MQQIKKSVRKIMENVIEATKFYYQGKRKRGWQEREKFISVNDLVNFHFKKFSSTDHPCRETMLMALEHLNGSPAVIVETGSSAWGTNSSLLFDSYVNSFGGTFKSVDIRVKPMLTLSLKCSKKAFFYCDDSISFLKKISLGNDKVDLYYLDSWDVDWDDPMPSAIHGFREFITIYPLLSKSGGLLLIDDTPKDRNVMLKVHKHKVNEYSFFLRKYGFAPGKGALVKKFLEENMNVQLLAHDYQLLYKFSAEENSLHEI